MTLLFLCEILVIIFYEIHNTYFYNTVILVNITKLWYDYISGTTTHYNGTLHYNTTKCFVV